MFEDRTTSNKRTELEELGEFGLIKQLTKQFVVSDSAAVSKGVGDDAAVLHNGKNQVVTSDMLCEGVHFDLSYVPLKHLGYKAVVVNISDIYAMNATPKQILVNISISNRFSVEALSELYDGIYMACKKYNITLVGGDTCSSKSGLIVSITAIGEIEDKKSLVYRDGANEHDIVCLSGDVGGAYMGLLLLEREKEVFKTNPDMQPDLAGFDYLLERQLKPEARKDIIQMLKDSGVVPTSMIDVSDGVASELMHLCTQSKVGCTIYEDKLPIDHQTYNTAQEFEIDPTTAALNGGEDYELLFTLKQADYEKLKEVKLFEAIGHITNETAAYQLVSKDGKQFPITAQGWQHI